MSANDLINISFTLPRNLLNFKLQTNNKNLFRMLVRRASLAIRNRKAHNIVWDNSYVQVLEQNKRATSIVENVTKSSEEPISDVEIGNDFLVKKYLTRFR